jgi:hypothetical protein
LRCVADADKARDVLLQKLSVSIKREAELAAKRKSDSKHWKQAKDAMAQGLRTAITTLQRYEFRDDYCYTSDDVAELTLHISASLKESPRELSNTKLFHCVRDRWEEYDCKSSKRCPLDHGADVRMLLSTCLASSQFLPKERGHIMAWMQKEQWLGDQ